MIGSIFERKGKLRSFIAINWSKIILKVGKINFNIKWKGKGIKEKAINIENKEVIIECKKRYFRPLEVENLQGDFSKAKKLLRWKPRKNIKILVKEMVDFELKENG